MDDLNCRLKIWVSWPFKNISLISIQSLIRGGRKLEYPGEKPLDLPVQNLIYLTCAASKARITAVRDPIFKSQHS